MAKTQGRSAPVSVAMNKTQKDALQAEARRRGLGLSTAIRALALERIDDLRRERQRARAMRWQLERLRERIAEIEANGFDEVSQAEIDALFADALNPQQDDLAKT